MAGMPGGNPHKTKVLKTRSIDGCESSPNTTIKWSMVITMIVLSLFLIIGNNPKQSNDQIQTSSLIQLPDHFVDNTDTRTDVYEEIVITQSIVVGQHRYFVGTYKKKEYVFSNGYVTKLD